MFQQAQMSLHDLNMKENTEHFNQTLFFNSDPSYV